MAKLRRCPVCKRMVIRRPDARTCGGADCVKLWRELTSAEKAKLERQAEADLIPIVESLENQAGKAIASTHHEEPIKTPIQNPDPNQLPPALDELIGPTTKSEICEAHGKAMCFICSGVIKETRSKEEQNP